MAANQNILYYGDNHVVFTLYERCVNISNPYFLFQITDQESNDVTYFTCGPDFSPNPYHYNFFTISITATMSGLTAGILPIPPSNYSYIAYEMSQPYDLNVNNAIKIVEYGELQVVSTYSTVPVFQNTKIIPVFQN